MGVEVVLTDVPDSVMAFQLQWRCEVLEVGGGQAHRWA